MVVIAVVVVIMNYGRSQVYGITRVTRRPELFGLAGVAAGGAILATNATQLALYVYVCMYVCMYVCR